MKSVEVDFIYNLERIHGTLNRVADSGSSEVWELKVEKLYWGRLFKTGTAWDFEGGYYVGKRFAEKLSAYVTAGN